MRKLRRWKASAFVNLFALLLPGAVLASGPVSWGDFAVALPQVGVPTTVSLGGGSTVDVTVNTGGTQGISFADYNAIGAMESGLDYSDLTAFGIFNGGGPGAVTTTIVYSNFQVAPAHASGYLFVGAVNGASSPITVTSSVPGAVETWTQVGSTFDLDASNSMPIGWNAPSGTFTTDAPVGIDSDGIIVEVGVLSQYSSITISLQQFLNDGIVFSIGEEINTSTGVEIFDDEGTTWGAIKGLYR